MDKEKVEFRVEYTLVYITETDGDVKLARGTDTEIKSFIAKKGLSNEDFAVISGEIVSKFGESFE